MDSSDMETPYTGAPVMKPQSSTIPRPEDSGEDMEQTNPWVVPAWGTEGEPRDPDTDVKSSSKRRRPR